LLRSLSGLLLLLFFAPSFSHGAEGLAFSFDKNLEGWQVYGEGKGSHVEGTGHSAAGALSIEADSKTQMTAYKVFKNLTPGRYLVEGWFRSRDILVGEWDHSAWIFYDAGKGHQTVVKDLKGSFEWSRLRFTIEVEDKPVTLWFRLKASGSLWVDDLTLTPTTEAAIAYEFTRSKTPISVPNPIGEGIRCPKCYLWTDAEATHCPFCSTALHAQSSKASAKAGSPAVRVLMDFEEVDEAIENQRHSIRSFNDQDATSGKRSGIIRYAAYNHLEMKNDSLSDWSGYDYLAMEVFNPLDKYVRFSMSVKDTNEGGYWNQLNHNATLAPGWNRLKIHVNRFVGERGSVRNKRYLDLEKLIDFWFGVGVEQKEGYQEEFLVDNVRLLKATPSPATFRGLKLFDFVKEDFRAEEGFTAILARHKYSKHVGFGLTEAEIWRSHDSLYADNLNRDGIFLNRGGFAVDLPDGQYEVRLNVNHLGVWNEHFWAQRKVTIESKEALSESRESVRDYVQSFTRFQEIEPGREDDAYSLYLDNLFAPLVQKVQVSDGQLNIDVAGDPSGICLNWLAIYPADKKSEAETFFQQLKTVQKEQFDSMIRKLEPAGDEPKDFATDQQMQAGFYSAIIAGDTFVRPGQLSKPVAETIELAGGRLQRPAQTLLVRSLGQGGILSVKAEDLISETGGKIAVTPQTVRFAVNQYQCHTFNHETYELAPRFYRNLPSTGISLADDTSKMLRYQVEINGDTEPGIYTGQIVLKFRATTVTYPVSLTVYPFTLPPTDIAVGFFGLNPFRLDHVKTEGLDDFYQRVNMKVLESLSDRGFTTWSSLPAAKLVEKEGADVIESPQLDQLMAEARRLGFHKVFTYGGGLDDVVRIEEAEKISGRPADEFHRAAGAALSAKLASQWLPIVYNYSDEASGYSQKMERDLQRAEILKQYYPMLGHGGFSRAISKGKPGYDLNQTFTVGSYSSMTREAATAITEAKNRWGLYNPAIGNLQYNREVFGQALFTARKAGADHLLEWYLNGSQNYPYYDLDGRENDAMMLFPRADGRFDFSIKFEWAAEGMEDYRLLQLLESKAKAAGDKGEAARRWLAENYPAADFFDATDGLIDITPKHGLRGQAFRAAVYPMLLELNDPG